MLKRRSKTCLLWVVLLLTTSQILSAQNTGYMGKHFIFNMGVTFSPAWRQPNFAENPKFHNKWYSFNYTLSPNLEAIVWKWGTVGLSYHYFETKYAHKHYVLDDRYFVVETIEIGLPIKSHGFGVFYKQYMNDNSGYAPMGLYSKFQVDGFFYKAYGMGGAFFRDNNFGFKYELGDDFLFFNTMRVSIGFSMGGMFKGISLLGNYFFGSREQTVEVNRRIWSHYWVGFNLNVGLLAF
ncbi:MAG TPA: hypothetical protein PLF32_06570 [Bacteroidales bacterium]|jgi:hypothetical protein|nr:hypothetical protein [Bacteroidales bacterium]HOF16614.1 hypothetical protein [Bacteroidales bacterium]HOR82302.1 hypothetical protein [Bacteroidales bacterium]HPJ91907.1 hypothetical protein [Bacteroidales bacterium]